MKTEQEIRERIKEEKGKIKFYKNYVIKSEDAIKNQIKELEWVLDDKPEKIEKIMFGDKSEIELLSEIAIKLNKIIDHINEN